MSARAPAAAVLSLLRASTTTIRHQASTTSHQTTRPLSQLPSRRSQSPPPPYSKYNNPTPPFATNSTQWTRFSTPYSLSSIRTFSKRTTNTHNFTSQPSRAYTTPSKPNPAAAEAISTAVETISELYGTARDEFEMAAEETEKNTTYAADDRAAAREELDRLLEFYSRVLQGEDRAVAEEVKNRVGGKIRELEAAVLQMEEGVAGGDH